MEQGECKEGCERVGWAESGAGPGWGAVSIALWMPGAERKVQRKCISPAAGYLVSGGDFAKGGNAYKLWL